MYQDNPLNLKTFLAAIAGVLVLWLPVLLLHLTLVLFAALITYASALAISRRLRRYFPNFRQAEFSSIVIMLGLLGLIGYGLGEWLGDKVINYPLTTLLKQTANILDQIHATLPATIAQHIPESVETLQQTLSKTLRDHAAQVKTASIHTVRGIGYVVIGMVIGAIAVVQLAPNKVKQYKALSQLIHTQFIELLNGFTEVFFAQVRISALNTTLTAIYLIGILPLIDKPLPMTTTLIFVTFLAGLIPVVGNLISNTFIVIISLSDSLTVTIMSLGWLVAIHKLEYFLNAQIIGHKIKAAAWELLIAMLVMEALFGIAGLVSAPIMYAQIKHALINKGWV